MGVIIPTSQGALRIAEIPYVKCLASDLADNNSSLVELGYNWEYLGRLPGGGRDTNSALKDKKDFSIGKDKGVPVFMKGDTKAGCLLMAVPVTVALEAEGEVPSLPFHPTRTPV